METKVQLRKKILKRRLKISEKILLLILVTIVLIWLLYKFILIPQKLKLKKLRDEKINYVNNIWEINECIKDEGEIYENIARINREKEDILVQYFSRLSQPEIIYILNDLLEAPDFIVKEIYFSEPYIEEIDTLNLDCIDITIPYESKYEALISVLKRIKTSPKKFVINNLIMNNNEKGFLEGNISLKVYSLGEMLYDESVISIASKASVNKDDPFKPFENFKLNNSEEADDKIENDSYIVHKPFYEDVPKEFISKDVVIDRRTQYKTSDKKHKNSDKTNIKTDIRKKLRKVVLEDFEGRDIYFIPSGLNVKGNLTKSQNSKSGNSSLRFEYNILAIEEENKAFADLMNRNIIVKYPPSSLGLWIYSYEYSPITIGVRFSGQTDEKIDVKVAEGVDWTGWKYIEFNSPKDLKLYPLQIEKIYIELNQDREDYGVILFDKLEANYVKTDNNVDDNNYFFYVVQKGDTLGTISKKVYGTSSKKQDIIRVNELKNNYDLKPGKILVIPR